MTGQKGKGTRSIEVFEYENTRSDAKCCDLLGKMKSNMSDYR